MFIICLFCSMRASQDDAHHHLPGILNVTRHRVSSKLLFQEISLTPKETKNPFSTFRKQHFPKNFNPWSQTVSPWKPRNVKSAECPPNCVRATCLLACFTGEVPCPTLQLQFFPYGFLATGPPQILQLDCIQSTLAQTSL